MAEVGVIQGENRKASRTILTWTRDSVYSWNQVCLEKPWGPLLLYLKAILQSFDEPSSFGEQLCKFLLFFFCVIKRYWGTRSSQGRLCLLCCFTFRAFYQRLNPTQGCREKCWIGRKTLAFVHKWRWGCMASQLYLALQLERLWS